jgi:NADPH:quinone reductase-like Zn-dependent oxidoreductase
VARGLFGRAARPKLVALGADVSGRVRAVGSKVRDLSVGDEVIADLSGSGFGAFAEQVRAPARVWVRKPAFLSHEEAAAVPMASVTALKGLRDIAKIGSGDRVLVVGATGGVGSFAVQIARALGAEVTATSRAEKAGLLEELGVTEIVESSTLDDRLTSDAFQGRFQLVFDCAAYRSPFAFLGALAKGGRYLQVGGAIGRGVEAALFGTVARLATGRSFGMMYSAPDAQRLADVVALIEAKQVRPIVDRVFPLSQVQEAMRHLEDRHTRGKVILSVTD